MDNGNIDIVCSKCGRQEVCALKVDFAKAQEAVNNCEVNLGLQNENGNCVAYKYLSNFDYIEPVVLRCKYFTLN